MRNLKKVLSLTLALVMMLSMMTFAGAAETTKVSTATDLTDMKDVTNKEAVTLLVDLKVVAGRDDGAFDPAGSLKRAEFAKLIYVAKMGSDDKAANFVNAATGLTDIAGTWFEGYVNYAFSTGIVSGTSKTTFTPNGLVKVAEAAKMLLVGLGYDAKAEGYSDNALWSVNVMQQARQSGLLEGIKLGANVALTRDAAAQMVFNALMSKTVTNTYGFDMNGKKYITGATVNKTTWGEEIFDLQKVEGTVDGINGGKAVINGTVTSLAANPSVIGANAVYYKNATTGKTISTALVLGNSTILATSTDTETLAHLTDITKTDYIVGLDANAKYFVNGGSKDSTDAGTAVDGKTGVIVEFIDNNANGKADTVRITVKTVATIDEKGVTIVKATAANKVDGIVIDGISALNGTIPAANVFGYEGLKEDDVVLYYVIDGKYYIEKAASVTGTITSQKGAKYMMGDNGYTLSKLTNSATAGDIKFSKDVTLFLDNNKSIVKLVLNEKDAPAKNAVVLDILFVENATVGTTGGHTEALLLYADGTTGIVKVGKIDGCTPVKAGVTKASLDSTATHTITADTYAALGTAIDTTKTITAIADNVADGKYLALFKDSNGSATSITGTTTALGKYVGIAASKGASALEGLIYGYKENKAAGTVDLISTTKSAVDTGTAYVTGSTTIGKSTGIVNVNSKTTFLVTTKKDNAPVYTAYEGINKMPGLTTTLEGVALVDATTKFATVVYLSVADLAAAEAKDYAFITNTTPVQMFPETTTTAQYWEYAAVVNGVVTTVKANSATMFSKVGFWGLTLTDGIATGVTDRAAADDGTTGIKNFAAVTGTVKAANGVIGLGATAAAATYYTYTSDAKVFFIDFTTRAVTVGKMSDVLTHATDIAYATVAKVGSEATATEKTTITALFIEVKEGSSAGADGGSAGVASKFSLSFVDSASSYFDTATAGKVIFKAKVTAIAGTTTEAPVVKMVPYVLQSNGTWLEMATKTGSAGSLAESATIDNATVATSGSIGVTIKCDVTVTYNGESTTIQSGPIFIDRNVA